MDKEKKRLGQMLIEAKLIDEVQLKSALAEQTEWGGRLGSIIIKKGFVSEIDILSVIEKQLGLPCISLENIEKPADGILKLVRVDVAKKFGIFPISLDGKTLSIAMSDPADLKTLDDIGFMLNVRIKPILALESDIKRAIEFHYEGNFSPGSSFRIDKEKLAEKISHTMPSNMEIEHAAPSPFNSEANATKSPKQDASQKIVIESIVDLLIEKGIFTKAELINRIRSKKQ